MIRTLVFICALIELSILSASAQTCAGYGSFDDGSGLVTASGMFAPHARTFGATVSGRTNGFIGGGGFSATKDEDLDIWSSAVSATGGTEVRVGSGNAVFICPAGQLEYSFPFTVAGAEVSRLGLAVGGRVGVRFGVARGLALVPTVGTLLVHQRQQVDDLTASETGGVALAGMGLVFNRRYSVVPLFVAPFAFSSSSKQFSVQLGVNFGR